MIAQAAHPGRPRLADWARRGSCRRAAATSRAARPMQSPRFPAMARCAAAGSPPGACSAATPGGGPATIRYPERQTVRDSSERQQEHDPGDRPVGDRAARLGLRSPNASSRPQPAGRPRSRRARPVPVPQPQAGPAADTPARDPRPRRRARARRRGCAIETPRLAGSINLKGARIDDLVLTDHRETVARNSPPVRLFSPGRHRPTPISRSFGWTGEQGAACPAPTPSGRPSGARLTPATPVTLSWNNGQGQIFQIRLSIDETYLFTRRAARRSIAAPGAVAVRPYALVSRAGAVARSRQLDHACRPDGRVQRRGQLRQRL